MPSPKTRRLASLLALLVAARAWAASPPLADRVPAAALAYAAWPGTGTLQGFNDTHFGHLAAAMNLRAVVHQAVLQQHPQADGNPVVADIESLVEGVAKYAWENPCAVYTLGKGVSDDLATAPHFCCMIDFGTPDAATNAERDVQSRLDRLVQGNPIPNVRFFKSGSVLALDLNSPTERNPLAPLEQPITGDPKFQAAQAKVAAADATPALFVFANLEHIWPLIDEGNQENAEYALGMAVIGTKGATALALTARPDGNDWHTRAFLQLSPQASGAVGALATTRPASPDVFAGVPASCSSATTFSLDPARALAIAKVQGNAIQPGVGTQIDAWVQLGGAMLNVDLRRFLQDLGPTVTLLTIPTKGDPTTFRYAVMLCPTDAGKTQAQLRTLLEGVDRLITARNPNFPRPQVAQEGAATTVSAGPVKLAWASDGKHLYVAQDALTLANLLDESSAKPLSADAGFADLARRLNAPPGATLSYTDYTASVVAMLQAWKYEAQQEPAKFHPDLQAILWPPVEAFRAEQAPGLSATWVETDGLRYECIAPYPGAEALHPLLSVLIGEHSPRRTFKREP